MHHAAISVVIPNFNGQHLLLSCLPSVIASSDLYPGETEIIVVDDASTDDSLQVLTEHFSDVVVIKHLQNQGFSQAVHTGVKACKFDYVFLLNSDVTPEPHAVEPLMMALKRHPENFSASPLIYKQKGLVGQPSFNKHHIKRGTLKKSNIGTPLDESKTYPHSNASGGSMLFRKQFFIALSGFSDIYRPFYFEDFDLGLRAWRRGWKTLFVPASKVLHPEGATIKKTSDMKFIKRTIARNRHLLHWIHLSKQDLCIAYIPSTFLHLVESLITLKWNNLGAFFAAVYQSPKAFRMRRKVQAESRYSLRSVINQINQNVN